MSDNTELKRLAEAATQGDWTHWKHGVIKGGPSVQFTNGSSQQQIVMTTGAEWMRPGEQYANADFIAAANPAAVRALIAENERLKTLRSVTERDLAQELEVWRHGPSCWNCGDTGDVHDMVGEWIGQCDCNAAKLIDISSERDQFRAEIAGFKTGYEAYERVNAELKAENERLERNRDMWKGQVDRQCETIEGLRKALRPLLAHWDDLKAGESLNVDAARAAMGKGEQS